MKTGIMWRSVKKDPPPACTTVLFWALGRVEVGHLTHRRLDGMPLERFWETYDVALGAVYSRAYAEEDVEWWAPINKPWQEGQGENNEMWFSAKMISEYVLMYCTQRGEPINNFKLQEMLYFLWLDYYMKTKKELFCDTFSAWKIGPVVPDIYYEFCQYGALPIFKSSNASIDVPDSNIINEIIEHYLPKKVHELIAVSCCPKSPWATVYQNGAGFRYPIPASLIKKEAESYE